VRGLAINTRLYASGMRVALRDITEDNRAAVTALEVEPSQRRFVSSVADSLAEAHETPEGKPWYRAIYADDRPVGFLMLSWDVPPDPPRIFGPWFLWKLLIDRRYQRLGYGREAVMLAVALVRANGGTELLTSYGVGECGPEPFYRRLGFRPTGDVDETGEIVCALELAGG
jgi:RimJ/RimL family protein N-acetyltransferase